MIRSTIHKIKKALEHRAVVLMYHRIATADFDPWKLCVSPQNFAEHLQVLSKYNVIPLPELVSKYNNGKLPRRSVAITFDDGYIDNYTVAKPLLEKYNLPATFFIATGYIDEGKEFWWDELEYFQQNMVVNFTEETYLKTWQDMFPNLPADHEKIFEQWSKSTAMERSERTEYLCMSGKQLKEMASNKLFDIEAHTVHHPALAHQSETIQQQEISDSRKWLHQLTGKMPMLLAYPYGNYNESTVNIAAEQKLDAAFTTDPKPITKKSARYQLGRFQAMDWNGEEFDEQLQGWLKI